MASPPSQTGVIHASRIPTCSKRPHPPTSPGDINMITSNTMDGITPKCSAKRRKTEAHTLQRLPVIYDSGEEMPSSPLVAALAELSPEPQFEDEIDLSTPTRRKFPVQGSNDEITKFHVAAVEEFNDYMPPSPPLPAVPDLEDDKDVDISMETPKLRKKGTLLCNDEIISVYTDNDIPSSLPLPIKASDHDINKYCGKHCETAFGAYKFQSSTLGASTISDVEGYIPSSPPRLESPQFDDNDLDMDISMSTPKRSKIPVSTSRINTTPSTATVQDTNTYMPSSPPHPVRPDANEYEFTMSPQRTSHQTTINTTHIPSTIGASTTNYAYSRAATVQGQDVEQDFDTFLARENPPPTGSDTEAATDVDEDMPSSPPPVARPSPAGSVRVRVHDYCISIYEDGNDSTTEAATSRSSSSSPSLASTADPSQPERRRTPPISPNSIFQGTRHDDTSSALQFDIFCDNLDDGPAFAYEPVVNRRRGRPDDWIREEEMLRMRTQAGRRVGAGGLRGGDGFGIYEDESSEDEEQEQAQRGRGTRSPDRFRR